MLKSLTLLMVVLCCRETFAQEAPKQTAKVCVALQNDYSPDQRREKDPRDYFGFPFDLALQDAPASDVDYSPDGEFLAFGMGWFNQGGWLTVWDLQKEKAKFTVWLGLGMRCVQYSPDGTKIAVACFDQSAKVFDAEDGKLLAVLPLTGTNGTNSVSFSPNGKTIATGGLHKDVILWDATTFKEQRRLKGHKIRIYCAMFSPDGQKIASVDRNGIGIVWDVQTGQEICKLEGHQGGIEAVEFTRDSKYVVTGGWDGTVRFWDPATGQANVDLQRRLNAGAMCLATSPDGKWLVSGGQPNFIEIFDYQNNEINQFAHGCEQQLYGICFSPNGKEMASASFDGTVKRWEADTQQLIETIDMKVQLGEEPPSSSIAVDWSADGKKIVSGHEDGSVRLRDATTGKMTRLLDAHSAEVAAVAFHPEGRRVVSCGCDHQVLLWDLQTLEKDERAKPVTLAGHEDWVVTCAFSSEGRWLATGSLDKTVRIWDLQQEGKLDRLLEDHRAGVRSLDFSPDGKWLVTGADGGHVYRHNLATKKSFRLFKRQKLRCIRFSPSGKQLAIGFELGGLFLFDTETWKDPRKLDKAFQLTSLAWSPSEQLMASGNLKGKVVLRDLETNEVIKTFGHHAAAVTAVDFAPSGNAIVSGSVDTRILRWNALLPKAK